MARIDELEKILESVCGNYENDCSKCPRQKECEEYCKLEGFCKIINKQSVTAEMMGLEEKKQEETKMVEKLKKAFESRQKKEKNFEKSFAQLEVITEKYLVAMRK